MDNTSFFAEKSPFQKSVVKLLKCTSSIATNYKDSKLILLKVKLLVKDCLVDNHTSVTPVNNSDSEADVQ